MKTVFAYFSNHFDLIWRRSWERDYVFHGGTYASYQHVEEQCLLKNIELAERGEGAYSVEQALTMRAFLRKHPDALPRLKALYAKGLFEMCGAGEAIIDVNMCSFETMCRNLASGLRYCRDVLGMPPAFANHGDGFGSSAQFPQVIRQCGLPGISGLSYSYPDNKYWRGLDGSTILVWWGVPGRGYFFDHCYHEPCRVCQGSARETCTACRGTGFDLPQNFYPPFEPVPADKFIENVAQYNACSEEMLPPENFTANFRRWEKETPGTVYQWGTPRSLSRLWEVPARAVDHPPADTVASRVENNPVQTGCYVSRIRIKQEARRCEAILYGWETALASTLPQRMEPGRCESLFLELPLFFFHDAVTGTHQDEAYAELMDRMRAVQDGASREALATLQKAGWQVAPAQIAPDIPGQALAVFNPSAAGIDTRIAIPTEDWRTAPTLVARTEDGRSLPVVFPWHRWSPAQPLIPARLIASVGSTARTRPDHGRAFIEATGLPALAWSRITLEAAPEPKPILDRVLENFALQVELGETGVDRIMDLASGAEIRGESVGLGGLLLDEDEGDPWGTRKPSAFRRSLAEFTRLLGALQFTGYSEAYYAGRYEPNLQFGREQDPSVFALEWTITVRLLDDARRIDFEFEIFWSSANRRVRAAFPVQSPTDAAWYSIPGGWLERQRYEQTETCLWSPNGDWPALHFVAAQPSSKGIGWAVVNYGTPSTRVQDGQILVSLVRSPGFGHCVAERYAQNYPMPVSGIRDAGWHHFSLSLTPHAGVADMPRLAALAAGLNHAPPAVREVATVKLPSTGWSLEGDDIDVVSVKRPFGKATASGSVIRLLNLRAAPNRAVLKLTPPAASVSTCRLTEDEAKDIPATNGCFELQFHPFEVKTIQVERG